MTVDMEPHQTIKEIKWALQARKGIPLKEQRLIFNGKDLANDAIISDVGLVEGTTLFLVLRLSGGGIAFKDITKAASNLTEDNFSDTATAPSWRMAEEGLNLIGVCPNKYCPSKGEEVVCPIGINTFDERTNVLCPSCENIINPNDCIYHQCQFMFEAAKAGEATQTSQWFKASREDTYQKISDNVGQANFRSLIIHCCPLEFYEQQRLRYLENYRGAARK